VFALERAQARRFRISQQIQRLEDRGADVSRLRASLGRLTEAQSNREFGTFRQLGNELQRQVALQKLRFDLQQQATNKDQLKAAVLQRNAESNGGARESIFALERAQARRFRLSQQIQLLEDKGADVSRLRTSLGRLTEAQTNREFGTFRQQSNELQRQIALERRKFDLRQKSSVELERQRRLEISNATSSPIRGGTQYLDSPIFLEQQQRNFLKNAPRSPVRGGINFPGSPIFEQNRKAQELLAQAQRNKELDEFFALSGSNAQPTTSRQGFANKFGGRIGSAVSSGLIGGAFPALFGQGLNASIGGLAGGVGGGLLGGGFGFGLSLVGTAIGSELDKAVTNAKLLGSALEDPISKFEELAAAGLLSSKSVSKTVQALIDSGKEAEAAATIQRDLAQTYGDLKNGQDLSNISEQLAASWSKLGIAMVEFKDGPLNGLFKFIQANAEYAFQSGRSKNVEDQLRQSGQGNLVPRLRKELAAPDVQYNVKKTTEIIDKYAQNLPAYKEATRQLKDAQDTRAKITQLTYKQIAADAQGNKELSGTLELDALRLKNQEKLQRLKAEGNYYADNKSKTGLGQAAKEANDQFKLDQQRLLEDEKQRALNERNAQFTSGLRLRDSRAEASLQALRPSFGAPGLQAFGALNELRQARDAAAEARRQSNESPDNANLRRAAEEARSNLVTAGIKFKSDLLEAYQAAKDAVVQITRSVQDAKLNLLGLQGGNEGVNSFLSGPAAIGRQRDAFNALLPQFQEAKRTAASLRPANDFAYQNGINNVGNGLAGSSFDYANNYMQSFIKSVQNEQRQKEDLQRTEDTKELAKATNSLLAINKLLNDSSTNVYKSLDAAAANIGNLAKKDWVVNVNVPGGSATGDVVSAINGRL
jgi:hypothetical protein